MRACLRVRREEIVTRALLKEGVASTRATNEAFIPDFGNHMISIQDYWNVND